MLTRERRVIIRLVHTEGAELIGYARVSTADQSLRLQIDALKAAGVLEENILVEKVSGASLKRPMLRRAIKYLRPGWTLVFWKLDRIARDMGQLIEISKEIKELGANMHSITEDLNTNTAIGTLYFNLLGMFAQFERDLTRERTKAGMEALKATGVTFGRKPVIVGDKYDAIFADLTRRNASNTAWLYTVAEVAKRHRVSTGAVNKHWPGWRTKQAEALRRKLKAKPKRTKP